MTVQDIIDELSDHGFTDTSTTRKVAMINDTVADLCSRAPWPFMEKTINLTFSGASAVPTNFPSDFRAAVSLVNTSTGYVLTPVRLDEASKTYSAYLATAGTPMGYFFLAGQLNVFSLPASTDVLQLRYIANHPVLVDSDVAATILIPSRHHRAIVLGALWKLYDMEDDPELAVRFEQHYENRINTMREDVFEQQFDRTQMIAVLDNDDMDSYYD